MPCARNNIRPQSFVKKDYMINITHNNYNFELELCKINVKMNIFKFKSHERKSNI